MGKSKRNAVAVENFNINDYLQSREDIIRKSMEANIRQERKRIEDNLLGYQLLASEGFDHGDIRGWNLQYADTYNITNPEDWSKIHRALGKLEQYAKEPVGDGRSRTVRVTLHPKDEKFYHFKFSFLKKLPKGQQSKCRIKTVVEKRQVIVCDV